jgi:hypothetical protein
VIITDQITEQVFSTALDVSQFDVLDLVLTVWFDSPLTGPGPSLTVSIITGMQMRDSTEPGWYIAGTFPAVTSNQTSIGANVVTLHLDGTSGGSKPIQKYIRWYIANSGFVARASAARFRVEGTGRRL